MPKIIFFDHAGTKRVAEATEGDTVMQAALFNGIPGIDADCGGGAACATCHIYVAADWLERTGEPDDVEQALLGMVEEIRPESRLSCQIKITTDLDGLTVTTPKSQQ